MTKERARDHLIGKIDGLVAGQPGEHLVDGRVPVEVGKRLLVESRSIFACPDPRRQIAFDQVRSFLAEHRGLAEYGLIEHGHEQGGGDFTHHKTSHEPA